MRQKKKNLEGSSKFGCPFQLLDSPFTIWRTKTRTSAWSELLKSFGCTNARMLLIERFPTPSLVYLDFVFLRIGILIELLVFDSFGFVPRYVVCCDVMFQSFLSAAICVVIFVFFADSVVPSSSSSWSSSSQLV